MLGELVKRVVNLAVIVLAAITFFLVPIGSGSKTLYQHVRAVFATEAADELGRELKKTGEDVVHEVKKGASSARPFDPAADAGK